MGGPEHHRCPRGIHGTREMGEYAKGVYSLCCLPSHQEFKWKSTKSFGGKKRLRSGPLMGFVAGLGSLQRHRYSGECPLTL